MARSLAPDAVEEFWQAAGSPVGLPPPASDPVEHLVALVAAADQDREEDFIIARIPDDPLPQMLVGEFEAQAQRMMALAVSGLIPLECCLLDEIELLVDRVADEEGNHRVYSEREGEVGVLAFPGLDDLLRWMGAVLNMLHGKINKDELRQLEEWLAPPWATVADSWESGPAAARKAYQELCALPLRAAWDSCLGSPWPSWEEPAAKLHLPARPYRARPAVVWATASFLATRHVALPTGVKTAELSGSQRLFLENLEDLRQAWFEHRVPLAIKQGLNGPRRLAAKAQAWIEAHNARWAGEDGPKAPISFITVVAAAMGRAIEKLVAEEKLEVVPGKTEALVDELTRTATKVRSTEDFLDGALRVLLNSKRVVELYAEDGEVRDTLQQYLDQALKALETGMPAS
jgi:hypothetical protein